jgi:hypothetical protein
MSIYGRDARLAARQVQTRRLFEPERLTAVSSEPTPDGLAGSARSPTESKEPTTAPRVRRRTASKDRAGNAWADWRSTGSEASAAQFYVSVSSWTQGTAAQLLRPSWPVGVPRPTSAEVESRLRDKLSALSGQSDYLGALRIARDEVVEELHQARRRCPRTPSP